MLTKIVKSTILIFDSLFINIHKAVKSFAGLCLPCLKFLVSTKKPLEWLYFFTHFLKFIFYKKFLLSGTNV